MISIRRLRTRYSSINQPSKHILRCFATKQDPVGKLVYTAPFTAAVRAVKMVSITSSVSMLIATPLMVLHGDSDIAMTTRVAACSAILTFSLGTTAMLHLCAKSYITRMFHDAAREVVTAETLSLFARRKRHVFNVSDAGPPSRVYSFATFQANSRSFFLHSEVMNDKLLLSKLVKEFIVLESTELSDTTNEPCNGKNTVT